MTLESLLKNVESVPPLSDVTYALQYLYADETIDIVKLVRVIESDVSLSVNILKMVNAPIYGFSQQIASISQSVSLLGTDKVYGLALKHVISEKIKANTRIYGLSHVEFNDMCHLQSKLVLEWYSSIDLDKAKILAPLTLIMETGKLILANEVMKCSFAKKYKQTFSESQTIEECEHNLIGTTSYFLTGILFKKWNLNPLYVNILKGLDFEEHTKEEVEQYIEIIDIIRLAINVKDILSDDSIDYASTIVEELGYSKDDFIRSCLKVKDNYELSKS